MDGVPFLFSFKPCWIIERREIKRGVSLDWFFGWCSPTRAARVQRNQAADQMDGEVQRIERE